MTDSRRLEAIRVAMTLVRAAILDEPWPNVDTIDPYAVLEELAQFCGTEVQIAAMTLRSTVDRELDDYLARATDTLGTPAAIISLRAEEDA